MEAAHVADEEELTQNHPQSQPDQNTINDGTTTTNAPPPNADIVLAASTLVKPATGSEPAPQVTTRPTSPTPTRRGRPTFVRGNTVNPRGRDSTTQGGLAATSTTPPTPAQYAATTPPPSAQPRVVRPPVRSKSQISASPLSAAAPCSGSGSMTQARIVRPTLQVQTSALFRLPTMTRKTMVVASPVTQNRFIGFMPTPSLKRKSHLDHHHQSHPQMRRRSDMKILDFQFDVSSILGLK
ncbi:hypothetical protein S83_050677 [Arachis hypogaea]